MEAELSYTTEQLLDMIGGRIVIGPIKLKDEPEGSMLMGNHVTEYNRHGEIVREEDVWSVRLTWE